MFTISKPFENYIRMRKRKKNHSHFVTRRTSGTSHRPPHPLFLAQLLSFNILITSPTSSDFGPYDVLSEEWEYPEILPENLSRQIEWGKGAEPKSGSSNR